MKKVLFFIVICSLMMPLQVFGHSYVGSSSPNEGELVEEPLEQIQVNFDAGIEQHTSIELVNEAGEVIPISEQSVEAQTLTAILVQPIYSGNYTIHWTALGSDGHTTEGTISFSVDAPEPDIIIEDEEVPEVAEEESILEEELSENEESSEENVHEVDMEVNEESSSNSALFLIIGIIILAVAFILVRRRK
ncbi:hypothetical protein BTR23_07745 [Alkalihalophilus pseudofirmus]|nr:hypothetical protein BTR23_07745 [Alkalihalophilus pseudofirmus]